MIKTVPIRNLEALAATLLFTLVGCAGSPNRPHPQYAPTFPTIHVQEKQATGAIYQTGADITLFEDLRARRVGDILTVYLAEQTNAMKSSGTSIEKTNSNGVINPLLAGRTRTIGHNSNLEFNMESSHEFNGESDSNQSNRLEGSIAVTVAQVLPGGNMIVQGEKWIRINQGNEYIRLRGIVRRADIGSDNSILSTQIADARISYGGTGAPAQANAMGWLSRFFISPMWPF